MDGRGARYVTDVHEHHVNLSVSNASATAIVKDADWKTVLTLHQRKQQALERKCANAAAQEVSKTSSLSIPKKKTSRKLQPLPKDD
ncbi:hypothetical protein MRX96_026355 [Rhipicephalus microplus]